jgi:hypothetical protein
MENAKILLSESNTIIVYFLESKKNKCSECYSDFGKLYIFQDADKNLTYCWNCVKNISNNRRVLIIHSTSITK